MFVSSTVLKIGTLLLMFAMVTNRLIIIKKSSFDNAIVITNTTGIDRIKEVIVLKRPLLTKIDNYLLPVIRNGVGKELVSQCIDKDNDGAWDELLIEVTVKAHASDTLQIGWSDKNVQGVFEKATNVRLSLRSDTREPSAEINSAERKRGFSQNIAKPFYQMEGPGIENDKVAFRAFFDYRNGKDVYGKTVQAPVLEQVGVGASWHELQPWGMDILQTGNSLGAGGLAVWENDKIARLGDADTSYFKSLYEGPLQASFVLNFKKWDVMQEKKDGSETVTITKGNFYYRNDIVLELNNRQRLLSGIANFTPYPLIFKKHNSSFSSVSTFGKQAEGSNTSLGLAIMFSSDDYIEHNTTDTASIIPNTSYVAMKPSVHVIKTIYFFACWEKTDARFATQPGFEKYLQRTADVIAHPIQAKVIFIAKNKTSSK